MDYLLGKADDPDTEESDAATTASTIPTTGTWARLPILGRVQAGAWLDTDMSASEPLGYAPVLADRAYQHRRQWIEINVGESMNLFYPDGALLHCVEAVGDLRNEDHVIAERLSEGGGKRERTCKELRITKAGARSLVGRSTNAIWNRPIALNAGSDTEVRIVGLVDGFYMRRRR